MITAPVRYHQNQFPPKAMDWLRLIPLIGPANAGLARYDGLLSAIPNAHILLSPLATPVSSESVSSKGNGLAAPYPADRASQRRPCAL